MSLTNIALAAHLVGVILWIGGEVAGAAIAASAVADGDARPTLKAARTALMRWAVPGMLLAWIGGLTMLIPNFTTLYARAGWMHGKLTLLLIASALSGILSARIRKAANGDKPLSAGFARGLAIAMAAIAAIVVALVVFRPGA
ncbi:MAG: CopD family protein [Sandaracinaceae bacterium]